MKTCDDDDDDVDEKDDSQEEYLCEDGSEDGVDGGYISDVMY